LPFLLEATRGENESEDFQASQIQKKRSEYMDADIYDVIAESIALSDKPV
jgi:hypothetical protein